MKKGFQRSRRTKTETRWVPALVLPTGCVEKLCDVKMVPSCDGATSCPWKTKLPLGRPRTGRLVPAWNRLVRSVRRRHRKDGARPHLPFLYRYAVASAFDWGRDWRFWERFAERSRGVIFHAAWGFVLEFRKYKEIRGTGVRGCNGRGI